MTDSMGLPRVGTGLLAAAMLLSACNQGDFSSAASRTEGEAFVVVRSATWVDPDGCEHWVFDTGAEGYMTPKLTPQGVPICGRTPPASRSGNGGATSDTATLTRFDPNDPDVDRGIDAHRLSDMRASIWVDPLGCQHWLIDDGVEGYLSNRLNTDGTPRCDGPDVRPGEVLGSSQRLNRNPQ